MNDPRRKDAIEPYQFENYQTETTETVDTFVEFFNLFALGINIAASFTRNPYFAWLGLFIGLASFLIKRSTSSGQQNIPSFIFSIFTLAVYYFFGRRVPVN
ncbi:PAT complex subunit Asterix [Anaeramoeba ignava]|uniref:PAT complex subunit Asterix n=1 Tax=Anaeramoeba ignava TaxID=1746090 RepID=A0A9Q0LV91_ANAIG|nr:PAT complex subunit Asterix [Anaeramoeba ignava]